MARKKVQWHKRGSWWKRLRLNWKYKDHLFRFLFQDKRDLLELYNALNNTNYRNLDDLEIVTMEDVIFLKMKNDWTMPSALGVFGICVRGSGTDSSGEKYRRGDSACNRLLRGTWYSNGYSN